MDRMRRRQLRGLERKLGYNFRNKALLDAALTHKSYAFEQPKASSAEWNERLEFFGDAVLGLVISEYLYLKFNRMQEGDLTRLKALVVCADTLNKNAQALSLGEYTLLGRGGRRMEGRGSHSKLSCALEAVLGAVYIDRGIKAARKVITDVFKADLAEIVRDRKINRDYKSILQERALKKTGQVPFYEVISQEGPEHKKEFVVSVRLAGQAYGKGWGLNKKAAQQMAAKEALDKMGS